MNDALVWTTRDGRKIPVTEMTDEHLQNTIAMLKRVEMPVPHDPTAWRRTTQRGR